MSEEIANDIVSDEKPLVTFALFAYNQEKYIREAVEGALAQRYSPLEIIISDDCSTDNTYKIITEEISKYTGDHKVSIFRNNLNLGIGGHINEIHKIANGQLIIHAAGDDISLSNRVERLYEIWKHESFKCAVIVSNAVLIDENGYSTGFLTDPSIKKHFFQTNNPVRIYSPINGCTLAFDRELFDIFGTMLDGLIAEDVVLHRRANILSGVVYVPDILVKYRIHTAGASNSNGKSKEAFLKHQERWTHDQLLGMLQLRIDLAKCNKNINPTIIGEILARELHLSRKNILLTGGFYEGFVQLLSEIKSNEFSNLLKIFLVKNLPSIVINSLLKLRHF